VNRAIGILVIFLFCSCAVEQSFAIKVTGTPGLKFSGSLCLTTIDGKVTTKSVDGIVPADYALEGTIVSVVFQKQSEEGKLKIEILKNGNIVNCSETIAAYGVVSITSQ